MRTRIKICGFTRVEDAVFAAKLGVDAVGLVFYPPSPRSITIIQAKHIVNALPAFVSVVALFVDEKESQIRKILSQVAIDTIQFHGDELAESCNIYDKPYLKAIRMKKGLNVLQEAEKYQDASALLLDAYRPGIKGGSGSQFDWDLIPEQCALPIILAGGLDVDNARQAIQVVKPYALDVSSGVEIKKGIKDAAKMTAFIEQTKEGNR